MESIQTRIFTSKTLYNVIKSLLILLIHVAESIYLYKRLSTVCLTRHISFTLIYNRQ